MEIRAWNQIQFIKCTNMNSKFSDGFNALKKWLSGLGFKTGIIVAVVCVLCYIISFAQMALPFSVGVKSALWVIFFGLAKTAQYTAILILGKEGVKRVRRFFS